MTTISTRRLAQVFVEVADTLVDDFDLIDFLHLVAERTATLVDVAGAGLLLADHHGRLQYMAASAEETRLLELFQVQSEEGPCQDAYRTGQAVINADLTTAHERWPMFAPRAVAAGYRSVHAIPLRLRSEVIGALNLFGGEAGRLEPEDTQVIQALADIATIAILQERTISRADRLTEQLQGALNSRVVIEQAKGVISQRYEVEMDQAFTLLRSYARRTNRRLSDVATAIVSDVIDYPDLAAH